jgi:hypothetical protein
LGHDSPWGFRTALRPLEPRCRPGAAPRHLPKAPIPLRLAAQVRLLGMSGLIFCMVMMEMWVVAKTSALTLSVAGTLKEVLTIACAEEVFHEHLSYVNMLGLLLCTPAGCKGLGPGLGLGLGFGLGLGLLGLESGSGACVALLGYGSAPGCVAPAGLPRGPRARLRTPGCSPDRSEAAGGAMHVRASAP